MFVSCPYRTNNISTLEEKNIGLFLTHVATHDSLKLRRDDVFKGQNEKVFHKFENFHIALAGPVSPLYVRRA